MQKYILHITDLHLANFEGLDEPLRDGFYRNYIDNFAKCILDKINKIDFCIVSGDLIDQGKIENYKHIEIILDYLILKLKITRDQLGLCIGNHDYKYKEDTGENSQELRSYFKKLSLKYANKNPLYKSDRADLYKINDEMYFLSIDATLDSTLKAVYTKNKGKFTTKNPDPRKNPGRISDTEIDQIDSNVRSKVPENALLLIAAHYPIEKFPSSVLYSEEEEFDNKHVWNFAANLRIRLNTIPSKLTCWFSGDTHAPDVLQDNNVIYIMTGRFGTSVKKPSQIPRQGKIIEITDNEHIIYTATCEPKTHNDSIHNAGWSLHKSKIRRITSANETLVEESVEYYSEEGNDFIELLSEEVQEQIIKAIKRDNLYSFGRFRTAHNSTSLGWVSINPLLNSGEILPSIVTKSKKRITGVLKIKSQNAVIIGLDFWGSIIGSQVSIGTGISNYCYATRGNGKYHLRSETSHNAIGEVISDIKDVIIFTDVVSCGETISRVINQIEEKKNNLDSKITIKYHIISVITDNREYKKEFSINISTFGTFCRELRIPVISDESLPESIMVPYNIDYNTSNN